MPSVRETTAVALVDDRPVRYTVRRTARARRLSLQVSRERGLVVVLPWRGTLADVERALREHAAWVARQVARHGVADGPQPCPELVTGHRFLLLGEPHALVVAGADGPRGSVAHDPATRTVTVRITPQDRLDPRPRLERWLRRLAGRRLRERTAALARETGLVPRRVMVGERTTRWGSCSRRGTVSLCYRLVMAPPWVADAVVLHELCHLRHMNHGPRFRALLARLCPDHAAADAWLRDRGHALRL